MNWREAATKEQRAFFGGAFGSIMSRDGCKRGELARALGVSVSTLWRWEEAEAAPELELWLRLRALISGRAVVSRGRFVEV